MKIRVKILLFSLSVLSCLSSLEGGLSVDYLDESTLFEISWPGKQKVAASSVKYSSMHGDYRVYMGPREGPN